MVATLAFAKPEEAGDCITDGVHAYTPKGYVAPTEPAVLKHLEWFKDQKLGLMMSFGLYSELGMMESWPLSDQDAKWSRKGVEWASGDDLKRRYIDLKRSFNPVRFNPADWAKTAKRTGFRYFTLTTKHHDGFCLWDTKYSDFKVTNSDCPFSRNPRADIVRHAFDAFRAEGLGISCYFSKPDWHHPDYWENCGIGFRTTPHPTYNWRKNRVRWNRFREYTRNQILELVRNYGKIDILWLDGGQVRPQNGLDIRLGEILAEARKTQPWLISADRAVGGPNENFITPEQTIPKTPIAVPWESCITIGQRWGYAYDGVYKSVRTLVHMLADVVAKGGNLALDVGPRPDGLLPQPAIERMEGLGEWLGKNGEAIYATRPVAPFRTKDWAYTASKDGTSVYAIRLWREDENPSRALAVDCGDAAKKIVAVTHLATGREIAFRADGNGGLVLTLPEGFETDGLADAFCLKVGR